MTWHHFRQAGLTGILLVLVAVLESKAAVGAWNSVADHTAAVQYAALSVSCALLAFIFSAIAGAMKHDERPHVRGRATLARIVSLACLLIPIGTLGSAMKHDRLVTEWPAYRASEAYQIDLRLANDTTVDRADPGFAWEQDQARRRIQEPTFTSATLFDFEWWYALFLQSIVITGAGIRLSPPATAEEIKHWRAVAAGKKGAATRKRNAQKRKARNRFRLIAGGKN
jgi:hypothetical protein